MISAPHKFSGKGAQVYLFSLKGELDGRLIVMRVVVVSIRRLHYFVRLGAE